MSDASLSSVYAALWHGVPLLTVALSADQESNAARTMRLGVGECADRVMCGVVVCVCVPICDHGYDCV